MKILEIFNNINVPGQNQFIVGKDLDQSLISYFSRIIFYFISFKMIRTVG
jgi:hypothetical protein